MALLLAMVAAAPGAMAQEGPPRFHPEGFVPEDLRELRSVGDLQYSPDGSRLAYAVGSELWIHDVARDTHTRFGGEDAPGLSSPRWSPDGGRLLLSGSLDGRSGLLIANADGTGLRFLAEVHGTNHPLPSVGERVTWSPDGRQVAFVSAVPGPEGPEETAEGDPIVIRRYLYRSTGSDGVTYFNDNRRLHIFVVDVESGATRQLTDGDGYEHSIDWSPDGREILFVSNREPDPDRFFNYDILAVEVETGAVRTLTRTESVLYRPVWSPDGRRIAFQGTRRGLTSSETTMEDTRTWVIDADGGNPRPIGLGIDHRQGAPVWSADGRWIYFTILTRGRTHLLRLPAEGGEAETIVDGTGRVGGWSVAPDGTVAHTFDTPERSGDLRIRDPRGGIRTVLSVNEALFARKRATEIESLVFVSFDGLEVEAFLTHPHGRTADSKHPMIVVIKGGPHSQQGPVFDATAQSYASLGWATLMVNYRGSTGYGQDFIDAIFADQNGAEGKDVLQGVEAAVRRNDWIDRDRIGVEGGSYGGQLTNWLITQTRQFAAAIPRAGIANLVSFNYLSYYHDYLAVEYGGKPHQAEIMDELWARSPLRHVAKVATPTMLVHGLNDHNVPTVEAEQFFIALRDVGVEAELVLYPRAGHGIREMGQRIDFLERSIAWYRKHFAGR